MFRFIKTINPLASGIFFLIWSINAFFLFGNTGRYASLATGFILIQLAAYWAPNKQGSLKFLMRALFFFALYLLIALALSQHTLSFLNIVFGLISIALLYAGYILGKNTDEFQSIPKYMLYLFTILTLSGVYQFFRFQLVQSIASRKLGFEEIIINPISVAYTHALLFLYFLGLIYLVKKKNIVTKSMLFSSLIAVLIVILSSQSKGAILFLALLFFWLALKGGRLTSKRTLRFLGRFIILAILTIAGLFLLSDHFPFIGDKINGLIARFELFLKFSSGKPVDPSALDRAEYYDNFFANLPTTIWVGQKDYIPYPHNQYMEIIMRWGLLGLPLLLFSIYCFIKALRKVRPSYYLENPMGMIIITSFLFSYFQSMTSLSLEMNRMLWLGLGFIYASKIYRINLSK